MREMSAISSNWGPRMKNEYTSWFPCRAWIARTTRGLAPTLEFLRVEAGESGLLTSDAQNIAKVPKHRSPSQRGFRRRRADEGPYIVVAYAAAGSDVRLLAPFERRRHPRP